MASTKSRIEWTDKTWNPIRGCSMISPGCERCYAQTMAHRFAGPGQPYEGLTRLTSQGPRWTGEIMTVPHDLRTPLRWRLSPKLGRPWRIFVNSMSDLYHPDVPLDFYRQVWSTMVQANWHEFQCLTKRPEIMVERTRNTEVPEHIWMGASVESADYVSRIDLLRQVQAPVRFLSLEPLLGPLPGLDLSGISWVIVGGESGPGARHMDISWVRDLRDQCVDQGVPFFFKQWGGQKKKTTGRELDGRTWDEFPMVPAQIA